MTDIDLATLSLGPLDGDDDPNLREYFVPFGNFDQLLNKSLFLVVGPKGTGKSAIKRHLLEARTDDGQEVIDLDEQFGFSLDDINATSPSEIKNKMKGYLVALILNRLAESNPGLLNERKVREITEGEAPLLHKLVRPLTFRATIVEYAMSDLFPREKRSSLPQLLDDSTKQAVVDTLDEIEADDIWLLVDDLDTVFTGDDEESTVKFVAAIISAASDVSIQMFEKRVWIVLFLRSEIYEELMRKAPELDKEMVYIWDIAWSREALTKFLAARIRWVTSAAKGQPEHRYFQMLFEVADEDETAELLTYLFERVINGPRDLLLLIDMARRTAVGEGADRIALSHVQQSEVDYGQRKLRQITSNFQRIYGDIDRVVERLFRGASQNYDRRSLETYINRELLTDPDAREDFKEQRWIRTSNRTDFIRILYQVGVIGYFNESEQRHVYVLEESNPDRHWTLNTDFRIHNAFAGYLELNNRAT